MSPAHPSSPNAAWSQHLLAPAATPSAALVWRMAALLPATRRSIRRYD